MALTNKSTVRAVKLIDTHGIAPRQSDGLYRAISSKLAGFIFIADCVICCATLWILFYTNKSLEKWF